MRTMIDRIEHHEQQTRRCFLYGIGLWFLHLNTVYTLASLACRWDWLSSTVLGLSALQWVEIVVSLVTTAVLCVLIYLPWREWRSYQAAQPADNPHLLRDTEKDRRPLIAALVLLMNSAFLLFVAGLLVPIIALHPCVPS